MTPTIRIQSWHIREIDDRDVPELRTLSKHAADIWAELSRAYTGYGLWDTTRRMMCGVILVHWRREDVAWVCKIDRLGGDYGIDVELVRHVQVLVANRDGCLCCIAGSERTDFYRSVGFKATKLYRQQQSQHDAWEMTWDPRKAVEA